MQGERWGYEMGAVERESDPRGVTVKYGAWFQVHRARLGPCVVGLFLLSRTISFTVGCGPATGAQGGKCNDNGCNTYCDPGLQCDNTSNTCVADSTQGGPSTPPVGCEELLDDACGANVGYRCYGGSVPKGTCTANSADSGATTYCCAPQCQVVDNDPACSSPATTYWCDDPLTPESVDAAATTCLQFPPAYRAHTYCCAPGDTCFAGPTDLMVPCAGPSAPVFCTGEAMPPSWQGCSTAAFDAGPGLQSFCCADGADGGDADVASATDADSAIPSSTP
jgi:hypothetical protein